MYPGSNIPNFLRPHMPRNQHVKPPGHYYEGNMPRRQPPWQQRNTNNFHNEEFKFWCETCDKGFRFANQLENHKLQHQKCNIDGCQYVAHPKVITRHIQMQHSSGLFKKISKLNNPEEIQKWRDERRMKYPTKENIEKKKAEISERIKRGEKMGMKQEKGKKRNEKTDFMDTRQKHQKRPKFHNLKRKLSSDVHKKQNPSNKICKIVPPLEETRTLKPFAGIQHLIDEDEEEVNDDIKNTLIEDDDFIEKFDEIKKQPEPTICGALTSLLCQYGSSDEEDGTEDTTTQLSSHNNNVKFVDKKEINNDKINEIKINKSKLSLVDKSPNNITNNIEKTIGSDNDSGPEETSIVKKETNLMSNNIKTTNQAKSKKPIVPKTVNSRQLNYARKKRQLPSTLLQKLLHREIRHERNIILQCIRHIVNNNFFDNKKN